MFEQAVEQCIRPTIDYAAHGIRYQAYDERYVRPIVDHLRKHKHVLIRAAMGSGKTRRVVEAVEALRPASLLVITPRQVFAHSMLGALRDLLPDLRLYRDVPQAQRGDHRFMVCQLESLWSLGPAPQFDFVVLDESESILAQFGSPTVRRFDDVVRAFEGVVRGAKFAVWSDAFLADRSLVTCRQLGGGGVFIENKFRPRRRRAVFVGRYNKAKTGLRATLASLAGQTNVVVSASLKFAYELAQDLPEADTLVISGDSSDEVKAQMVDVNAMWATFRTVIYTSAITVGVNFSTPGKFDNLLM